MTLLTEAAWSIAKTKKRYVAAGDEDAAVKAHARLEAVVAMTPDPKGTWRQLESRLARVGHAVPS